MKINEITGFYVKFNFDNNQPAIIDIAKKMNYGSGSIYQKFKNITSEDIHEELKAIKEIDFFMSETFSQSFNFTVIEKDFKKVKNFAVTIVKLLKQIHKFNEEVHVEIEKNMVVTVNELSFNV